MNDSTGKLCKVLPVSDLRLEIDLTLETLGWLKVEWVEGKRLKILTESRVFWFCVETLKREGKAKILFQLLEKHPPDRHWLVVRWMLSDEAIAALHRNLQTYLLKETA